jgi:hypothetical protein
MDGNPRILESYEIVEGLGLPITGRLPLPINALYYYDKYAGTGIASTKPLPIHLSTPATNRGTRAPCDTASDGAQCP